MHDKNFLREFFDQKILWILNSHPEIPCSDTTLLVVCGEGIQYLPVNRHNLPTCDPAFWCARYHWQSLKPLRQEFPVQP